MRLSHWRDVTGLSQDELAARLGEALGREVAPSSVGRWERGETDTSAEQRLAIAAVTLGAVSVIDMHATRLDWLAARGQLAPQLTEMPWPQSGQQI